MLTKRQKGESLLKIKVVRYTCDKCGKEFTEDQKMYRDIAMPAWEKEDAPLKTETPGEQDDPYAPPAAKKADPVLTSVSVDLCPACAKKVIKAKFDKTNKKIFF